MVTDVEPDRGYTYTMLSREPGNDQTGRLRLEPKGAIYRFINKKNEESMRALSRWLTDHPAYRPDLIQPTRDTPAEG